MRKSITDPEQLGNRITSHTLTRASLMRQNKGRLTLASSHHLVWITRGGGRAFIDSTQQGFGSNTAMFIPAETLFHLDLSPGSIGWMVGVPAKLRIPLPEIALLTSVLKPLNQRQLSNAFSAVQEEFITEQSMRGTALIYSVGLLAVLFNRLDSKNNRKGLVHDSAKRRLMRRFVSRLNDRYASPDTVRDYAANLGVTTTHLTRVCRETSGKPATLIIRDKTIEEAKFLLKESSQKIGVIATGLGFKSPAYFTRVFTEAVGIPPKLYRKNSAR